ncbi:hypothetical protein VNO77_33400 [Canavalia gladiata]|uniref:Uncharacterized protein n=1 Tax=Canavalia gladiata TaxID=3824 RepID=A0AAN9KEU2_CANGL
MAVTMRIDGYSVWPGTITTNTPIEIAIFEKPWCATSPKWVMVTGDNDFPGAYVGIGDARDHPGKQLITVVLMLGLEMEAVWS